MNVFIIAALSADGFLADTQNRQSKSTVWTSKEDYAFFVKRTKEAGVCLMGSKTYATIGHPLKDRLNIVSTSHPESISISKPLSEYRQGAAIDIPYTVNLSPSQIIEQLNTLGYNELAICGGSTIYTLWLQSGLVDPLYLTYEPILFGDGVPFLNAPLTQKLSLIRTTALSSQTTLQEFSTRL